MQFFRFYFRCNVHRYLVKFVLKCCYLLTYLLYSADCSLFVSILTMLGYQEVDPFQLSVRSLPANVYVLLSERSKLDFTLRLALNARKFSPMLLIALTRIEVNFLLVSTGHRILYVYDLSFFLDRL